MRLGFDAKRFYNNSTGLGNYARNLIGAFDERGMREAITLFTPRVSSPFLGLLDQNQDRTVIPTKKGALWRQVGIARDLEKKQIDVYHGLSAELPLQIPEGVKTVVTIHDMLFRRFPTYYSYFDRMIYDRKTRRAVEKADRVIAISQATKQDLINYYGKDPDLIHVIPVICRMPIINEAGQTSDSDRISGIPEEYLLCVSRFERRKNHLNLLKAMASLGSNAPHLVLAGADGDQLKALRAYVKDNKLQNQVSIVVNPPGTILSQLYANCRAFIFPSMYEGFGMPVLEAMQFRKVVMTTENSSMSEICGDSGLYFDAFDPESIAECISSASQGKLDEHSALLGAQIELFSTDRIVKAHQEIYSGLAS